MHYRVKVSSYVGFSESQMIIDHQEEILKRKVSQEPQEERSSRSSRGKILKILKRTDSQEEFFSRASRERILKILKRKDPQEPKEVHSLGSLLRLTLKAHEQLLYFTLSLFCT